MRGTSRQAMRVDARRATDGGYTAGITIDGTARSGRMARLTESPDGVMLAIGDDRERVLFIGRVDGDRIELAGHEQPGAQPMRIVLQRRRER